MRYKRMNLDKVINELIVSMNLDKVINELIVKSIFKKLNVDCLILLQKDFEEEYYDHKDDYGDIILKSKIQKPKFWVKNKNILRANLNLPIKDCLQEKIYNFIIAQCMVDSNLKKVFNKTAKDFIKEYWRNNKPDIEDYWVWPDIVIREDGHKRKEDYDHTDLTTYHWVFLFVEDNQIKIKYAQRWEEKSIVPNKEQLLNPYSIIKYPELIITETDYEKNPIWEIITSHSKI